MLAVAGPGEKLLISRNAHKSVISAVIVNGTLPVWVHPKFDERRHLAHPPEPADVEEQLRANPDAKGMLLITPTDWGSCADIRGVAEVCHRYGVPLIVDEAWGAHLPFHDQLPAWGMNADADLVVTSVHKMGAAIEQSSVFHLRGDRIDPTVLKQREDLLGTTSASTLVYASLDGWRRQMHEQGGELLGRALARADRIRARAGALDGLALLDSAAVGPGLAYDLDRLAITIDVRELGVSGMQATEWLREQERVDVGSADACRFSARITHADDDDTEARLVAALERLVAAAPRMAGGPPVRLPRPGALELEMGMLPRDAFFAAAEQIPAQKAAGRTSAELITPYPPGVPAVAPGEVISEEVLDYLRSGPPAGVLIPDAADPSLETLRVVAD
jgi:arginine/lysine/ornithine decarboxylase